MSKFKVGDEVCLKRDWAVGAVSDVKGKSVHVYLAEPYDMEVWYDEDMLEPFSEQGAIGE